MVNKHPRKTSFRKKYPSLLSLIKKGVRSVLAFLLFLLRNWFYILLAIVILWLAFKVFDFLRERYMEDQRAYAPTQASYEAESRAVEAAARQDEQAEGTLDQAEAEPVEWPQSADVSPDCKPIWPRTQTVPLPFIYSEVHDILQEMTESILLKQQQ